LHSENAPARKKNTTGEGQMKRLFAVLLITTALSWISAGVSTAQRRSFTVADDISLTHFGDSYGGDTRAITPAPDGNFVAVQSERGSLKDNRLEDDLRIYDLRQLEHYVTGKDPNNVAQPVWDIHEATNQDGANSCLIRHIRWLADSEGIAFLLRNEAGHIQLMLANLRDRKVVALTPAERDVSGFEIRDREHYAFTVKTERPERNHSDGDPATSVVEPKQTALEVVFSDDFRENSDRSELWAASGGPAAPVINRTTGSAIVLYEDGVDSLALSPTAASVLTALPLDNIPAEWVSRFLPAYPGAIDALKAGPQDLSAPIGVHYVSEYVNIELKSGIVTPLSGTPAAIRAGWWESAAASPAWSWDASAIVLPGVFLPDAGVSKGRPCIAVRESRADAPLECVDQLKRDLAHGREDGYVTINNIGFSPGRKDEILVGYETRDADSEGTREGVKTFVRVAPGIWKLKSNDVRSGSSGRLTLEIKMSFKVPPMLIATDAKSGDARLIWDPNPQLKQVDLGDPSLYHWKDQTGRDWYAILYMPSGYISGQHYPLVLENHGYSEDLFEPSGSFPSAFAAQELAAAGIAVLQMRDCAGRATANEGPCNVMGYESAVEQLVSAGLVDPKRVGIIGFSRTVYYVMEALTTSKIHFAAASITDGINLGYFQHILHSGATAWTNEDLSMMGGEPFGPSLRQWLERSPEFNLDKVSTPLRVVGGGRSRANALYMWEPYAIMREMNKPVEFVLLNTNEHILTNPTVRLAAQGGNVDWFRFWLQGHEDPDPSKAEQYIRWESLRKLRDVETQPH
jgi:hypothetical protein